MRTRAVGMLLALLLLSAQAAAAPSPEMARVHAIVEAMKIIKGESFYRSDIESCIAKMKQQAGIRAEHNGDSCPDKYLAFRKPEGSRLREEMLLSAETKENTNGQTSHSYNRFVLHLAEGEVQTVHGALINGNCYVRSVRFELSSPEQWIANMDRCDAMSNSAKEGFLFDLRDNPGGKVAPALRILATLSSNPDDALITEFFSASNMEKTYRARDATGGSEGYLGRYADRCVVVLVDENTASAAEMIAGVLKGWADRGRCARLIGERTFGKGIIQTKHTLGMDYTFLLTVAEFSVGSDKVPVHGIGVQPNDPLEEREMGVPFWRSGSAPSEEDFRRDIPLQVGLFNLSLFQLQYLRSE